MEKVSDIENVHSVSDWGALARRKRLKSEFKTIVKSALEDALKDGWEKQRENKTSRSILIQHSSLAIPLRSCPAHVSSGRSRGPG